MKSIYISIIVLFLLSLPVRSVQAQRTFVVNATTDEPDAVNGDGQCRTLEDVCTLRAAIEEANATQNRSVPNVIAFDDIPFINDTAIINITEGSLPFIDDPVLIDGERAPAEVIIYNASGQDGFTGFWITSRGAGSKIRGLTIGNFILSGIHVEADDTVIENNYIGVSRDGADYGNMAHGITVESDGVLIRGNVIGFNASSGIFMPVGANVSIRGNFLGTTPDFQPAGNVIGLSLLELASGVVGGQTRAASNIIGFNTSTGIYTRASDGVVIGNNYIGTNEEGDDLGNTAAGIILEGPNHAVGNTKEQGNVIGYNDLGIVVRDDDNIISGNYIGVDDAGKNIENRVGIYIAGDELYRPQYTHIGYGPYESIPLDTDRANTIAYNEEQGILIDDTFIPGDAPINNTIRGNHIYQNGLAGIDLIGNPGPDGNDVDDADTGANNLLNYPDVLRTAYNENRGVVFIEYAISSDSTLVSYPLTVDVYIADDSISGEGKTYIGSDTYATPDIVQQLELHHTLEPTDMLVLTVTDADGNTSEFSPTFLEPRNPEDAASTTHTEDKWDVTSLESFQVSPPYPNPFSGRTTFTVTSERDGPVRISLFDLLGREVKSVFEGPLRSGSPTSFDIEPSDLPDGVYWIRVETAGRQVVHSIVLRR